MVRAPLENKGSRKGVLDQEAEYLGSSALWHTNVLCDHREALPILSLHLLPHHWA